MLNKLTGADLRRLAIGQWPRQLGLGLAIDSPCDLAAKLPAHLAKRRAPFTDKVAATTRQQTVR